MRHFILLDPLEKLVLKKDSTILLALTLKQSGHDVFLLFEKDFYFRNDKEISYQVFDFDGKINQSCYVDEFLINSSSQVELNSGDIFHFRLDPPFDKRYLRYLWMVNSLKSKGIRIINDPVGVCGFNEKMLAYESANISSYVGQEFDSFYNFIQSINVDQIILKPLDLFQGIGVEKIKINEIEQNDLKKIFENKVKESMGPVVAQPFIKDVEKGEIRALFFNGIELGSILKVPPEGEYLANIAQGAKFHAVELDEDIKENCIKMCDKLSKYSVPWVAFDILGGELSEVNITCPGLLVEVSNAHGRNLAQEILMNL